MSTFTAILTSPEFAAVLLAGGFSEEECRKLLGGNAQRVVESALGGA